MLLRNSFSSVSSVSVGASVAFQTCGKNIAKPSTTTKANIPSAEMLSLVFSSMVSDGGFLYQPHRLTLKSITTIIATSCRDKQAQRKGRGASKASANIEGMDTAKAIPSNKMHRVFAFISFLPSSPQINPPCNRETRLPSVNSSLLKNFAVFTGCSAFPFLRARALLLPLAFSGTLL